MNLSRTIIIGNSGSGKSWLADRLAQQLQTPWIDLDLINWEPGGYNVARERQDAIKLAHEATAYDNWIAEGIYGWLARELMPKATALIWLNIDEEECQANIRSRGIRRNGNDDAFQALLAWTASYKTRQGSGSFSGHEQIFHEFAGPKLRLLSKDEVTAFANLK